MSESQNPNGYDMIFKIVLIGNTSVGKTNILSKYLSVFSVALILIITVISVFYIAEEIDHDCHGEECPICECIHICESTLHETQGKEIFVLPYAEFSLVPVTDDILFSVFISQTLVTYKVRMDS